MTAMEQIVRMVRMLEAETGRRAQFIYAATDVMQKIDKELADLGPPRKGVFKTYVLGALLEERPSLPPGVVVTTLKAVD